MGVVDKDRRAVAFAGEVEPALGALERLERGKHRARLAVGRDRKAGGGERVLDLEAADQRQPHGVVGAGIGELQHLREAVDRAVVEADALPAPADRQQPQPALLRRRDHLVGMLVIGDDHGGAARLHQIAEQPELGGEVGFERRMIVEMIAADIGEGAGGDAHAVEPKLIEAVRGRLQHQMRDVVAGEFVERAMQRDRIGRGQRAVDLAPGRHQPDGADAGRRLAGRFPDLARERRDRGLAAGAGDGRDGVGLVLEEARGGDARARGAHCRRARRRRRRAAAPAAPSPP